MATNAETQASTVEVLTTDLICATARLAGQRAVNREATLRWYRAVLRAREDLQAALPVGPRDHATQAVIDRAGQTLNNADDETRRLFRSWVGACVGDGSY